MKLTRYQWFGRYRIELWRAPNGNCNYAILPKGSNESIFSGWALNPTRAWKNAKDWLRRNRPDVMPQ